MSVKKAVILLTFGSVESLDDVAQYLGNIMKGRTPSPAMIEELKERYRLIGGKSPLRDITGKQVHALQKILDNNNKGKYAVFAGMRFSEPYIKDTLKEINEQGMTSITAIIMAPQKSGYTFSEYKKDIDIAMAEMHYTQDVCLITEWYDNPNYIRAVAEKIRQGLSYFGSNEKTAIIFSSHSLPLMYMQKDDPYEKQIHDTIKKIIELTELPFHWKQGYQSKGMIPGRWLEPDVESLMTELADNGYRNLLMVPIGFVADHIETLYDMDIIYKRKAESLGCNFKRTDSLNDSPAFIDALAEIVLNTSHKTGLL